MRKLIEKWKWEKLKWTGSKQEEPIGKNQEKRKKKNRGRKESRALFIPKKEKRKESRALDVAIISTSGFKNRGFNPIKRNLIPSKV